MNTHRSVVNFKNQHTVPPKHIKSSTDVATQTKPNLSWKKWTKKNTSLFLYLQHTSGWKKKTGAFLQAWGKTACYVNSAGENICSLLSHAHLCCCQETVQAALGMASLCYRKELSILLKYKTTTIEVLICILRLHGHARTHALLKIN